MKNIYTFANAPTFPVVVNGGWIDVNDDGVMDANDTVLDIEMKSYGTTVTPVTTFIADVNETVRENKLNDLVEKLNTASTRNDGNITAKDLLKVPSLAPRTVYVTANAIYKSMKEHNNTIPSESEIVTEFGNLDTLGLGADATAKDFEVQVVGALVLAGNAKKVSNQDVFEFEQDMPGAEVPELALALLKNNITGFNPHGLTFNADYTVKSDLGLTTWSVDGKTLIINGADGDREEYTFDSATPTNSGSVSMVGFYGSDVGSTPSVSTITVTAPVVVTPPVVTPPVSGGTTLDLNGYSAINIYTNTTQTQADIVKSTLSVFSAKSADIIASCEDFGFTEFTQAEGGGMVTKTYIISNTTPFVFRTCTQYDYTNVAYGNGSVNLVTYYGN